MDDSRIRAGVGGWTFEPWRGTFYPPGLPHARELAHASRQLTAIEVNGTYYSVFKPATFAQWRDATPDGFAFSLKAHMSCTNRKQLATAGDAIARFTGSGLEALGDRLGPIVWSFMPTKRFDPDDFAAFLGLLPREAGGRPLRHVLDVRHESFACEAYLALAHRHGCTTVHSDTGKFPSIADADSELAYIRLMRSEADCPTGYPEAELDKWAAGARAWTARSVRHEAWLMVINGAKERAPQAAQALVRRFR
jgi:uncharacterized protein YecE (DUF72 family)